jgi:hypothetical protein
VELSLSSAVVRLLQRPGVEFICFFLQTAAYMHDIVHFHCHTAPSTRRFTCSMPQAPVQRNHDLLQQRNFARWLLPPHQMQQQLMLQTTLKLGCPNNHGVPLPWCLASLCLADVVADMHEVVHLHCRTAPFMTRFTCPVSQAPVQMDHNPLQQHNSASKAAAHRSRGSSRGCRTKHMSVTNTKCLNHHSKDAGLPWCLASALPC